MTHPNEIIAAQHQPDQATLRGYLVGFGGSLVLTLGAYFVATNHSLVRKDKIAAIAALAFIQFVVQLVYFLHLGREFKPRWKLFVFLFMLGVVTILVAGSIWIMTNLNNRMSPSQMTNYMNDQDGL